MSTQKRLKNKILSMRLLEQDSILINETSAKLGLDKVEFVEALLYNFRSLTSTQQKALVNRYLTRKLK